MPIPVEDNIKTPLYIVLAKIAALWTVANAGYFVLFPLFGYELSYNAEPLVFAAYFLAWSLVSIFHFKDLFSALSPSQSQIWIYSALSLACAVIVWGLLYLFSLTSVLSGPALAPYSDILLATQWYFLPKSIEILMQQVLITTLVYALAVRFHTLKRVMVAYAASFGLAHILMFFVGSPSAYAAIMTAGALLSTFIFPRLMLRVRGGFVVAYTIHLVFYILLAITLHTWPPPDYGA
ncbi:MAG: hypothetical protein WAZ27_04850 [Minisyncoccia bacterium]